MKNEGTSIGLDDDSQKTGYRSKDCNTVLAWWALLVQLVPNAPLETEECVAPMALEDLMASMASMVAPMASMASMVASMASIGGFDGFDGVDDGGWIRRLR